VEKKIFAKLKSIERSIGLVIETYRYPPAHTLELSTDGFNGKQSSQNHDLNYKPAWPHFLSGL